MTPPAAGAPSRLDVTWLWLRKIGLAALAIALIEYFALPQLISARSDLTLIADASPPKLALALGLEILSVSSYTCLTRVILSRATRPRFVDQLRIDLTGLGVSHVVPGGGASAAALRFRLMTSWGIAPTEAASTAAVQTAVAALGLVATFALGVALGLPAIALDPVYATTGLLAVVLLAAVGLGLWWLSRRDRPTAPRLTRAVGHLSGWIATRANALLDTLRTIAARAAELSRDGDRRTAVFGWVAGNWLFDAACLWVCLWAYGLEVHPGALLTAYAAANLIGMLPITPGGLGILEGFLIPALTALGGVSGGTVALGVLTWRLMEFWLPVPVAGVAYLSLKVRPHASGAGSR